MRSLAAALGAGIALGWLDSRPGYDATGLTVFALLVVGAWTAAKAPANRWWLAGVLLGIWVPLFERSADSLAALGFALAGSALGRFVAASRVVARG